MNVRQKGANGERELAYWLKTNLKLDQTPTRNLEQVRSGGADIVDLYPFCIECKRVQTLDLQSWWIQVKTAAKNMIKDDDPDTIMKPIPIVAFRQNRQEWEFLISAEHIGLELGFLRLKERVFKEWANNILDKYTGS